MEISQIIPHVEALIFAADRPLPMLEILDLLNNALAFLEDRATLDQVETALEAIREKYSAEFYAFDVKESGGGYQFLTKKEYYQTVAQLNGEKFLKRLSTAALETLAIIAYKQPISKGEIEHIRGVSTDYSIQKLLEKELIVISGRSDKLPGKPLLYGTSKAFMDYFGLNSPNDLPKLKEIFEEESAQATLMLDLDSNGNSLPEDDDLVLIVSENGELVEQADLPAGAEDAGNISTIEQPEELPDVTAETTEEGPVAGEAWKEEDEGETEDDVTAEATEEGPVAGEEEWKEESDDEEDEEEDDDDVNEDEESEEDEESDDEEDDEEGEDDEDDLEEDDDEEDDDEESEEDEEDEDDLDDDEENDDEESDDDDKENKN